MTKEEAVEEEEAEEDDDDDNELTSQGTTLSFIIDNSLKMANSLWSSVQSSMPRKIFTFTIRYLNNSC